MPFFLISHEEIQNKMFDLDLTLNQLSLKYRRSIKKLFLCTSFFRVEHNMSLKYTF